MYKGPSAREIIKDIVRPQIVFKEKEFANPKIAHAHSTICLVLTFVFTIEMNSTLIFTTTLLMMTVMKSSILVEGITRKRLTLFALYSNSAYT